VWRYRGRSGHNRVGKQLYRQVAAKTAVPASPLVGEAKQRTWRLRGPLTQTWSDQTFILYIAS